MSCWGVSLFRRVAFESIYACAGASLDRIHAPSDFDHAESGPEHFVNTLNQVP